MKSGILVMHQGSIGDGVITFYALLALKRHYRRVEMVCRSWIGEIALKFGIIDRCIPADSQFVSMLFSNAADERWIKLLSNVDDVLLFSNAEDLAQSIRQFYQKPVYRVRPRSNPSEKIHTCDHIMNHMNGLGLIQDNNPILCEDRRARNFDPNRWIIHPGSGSIRKNWFLSGFIRVFDMAKAIGKTPEFLLGPAEFFMETMIIQEITDARIHKYSDWRHILELFERTGLFIGNDSGMSHLAAFIGVPVVAIFGPSDACRWKPVGRSVRVIRHHVECEPCFERQPNNCENPECLQRITPERVMGNYEL